MKVLLVVDVQQDFLPGGALPACVPDDFVARLNVLIESYSGEGCRVVYTRDWHPHDHVSFVDRKGDFPRHCVQGTAGAEFPSDLRVIGPIFPKGMNRDDEEFSAASKSDSPLVCYLRGSGVSEIVVVGIATEYCVLDHVLDLCRLSAEGDRWRVQVLHDAVAAVDAGSEKCALAKRRMVKAIAEIIETKHNAK